MARTISNINGTAGASCTCGSWLAHWEKFSRQRAVICSEQFCLETTDLVGGHVMFQDSNKWWIVPLCKKHNASSTLFNIGDNVVSISANKAETCEKTLPDIYGDMIKKR